VTVVIADDRAMLREGMVALLGRERDVEIVAHVANGEEALAAIRTHRPRVAVLAAELPRVSGVEVARRLREEGVATAVVLFSLEGEGTAPGAAEPGGPARLARGAKAADLVDAVRLAARGFAAGAGDGRDAEPAPAALTPRQREVLRHIARGFTSKEIAAALAIGATTVETHRAAIGQKLGLHSTAALVKYAIRHRLASLDEP
jgi:DNA-binding NarL/FixJ family response regulator